MTKRTGARVVTSCLAAWLLLSIDASGQAASDSTAIQQFQRAADSYAFSHRQVERRRDPMPLAAEGRLFTPVAAAAFRSRIASAVNGDCRAPEPAPDNFAVPVVNGSIAETTSLPPCIAARLPRLPEELEYRVAGAALVLADSHLRVVVDVLHGAFPRRDN